MYLAAQRAREHGCASREFMAVIDLITVLVNLIQLIMRFMSCRATPNAESKSVRLVRILNLP